MKIYALEIDFFRYISCYLNCMRMLRYNYKEKNHVKQQRREHILRICVLVISTNCRPRSKTAIGQLACVR